ncbi:MAG: recombination protein NinG [Prevotellaceae bacterium]|jgi:hypothetical protein|nr:recombination protein NinG [Prevotellaceae bacterium]
MPVKTDYYKRPIKYLKAKADKLCSEYTRIRDAGYNELVNCISCGKIVHWKDADAGHYVNRKHMSLRYDERNVNAQCRYCNRFCEGNMIGYHAGLIKKYGEDVIHYLEVKKHNTVKWGKFEYIIQIQEFEQKIKELKKLKNI